MVNLDKIRAEIAKRQEEVIAQAKERNEAKKLALLNTEAGITRFIQNQNIADIKAILADIESQIDSKIRLTFGYCPLSNLIIGYTMTTLYLTKNDREKIDPAYLDMTTDADRENLVALLGRTPYYREAEVINGVEVSPASIENAVEIDGEWEYTDFPDVDALIASIEQIALDIGLVDPKVNITEARMRVLYKRALDKALKERELAKTISMDNVIQYEE